MHKNTGESASTLSAKTQSTVTRDNFNETPATLAAAQARIDAIDPDAYNRTRNFLNGAVTRLSPYITHGLVSLDQVLRQVNSQQSLSIQHKFVYELGWREYFRHVWTHRGDDILSSFHEGPLAERHYRRQLPDDIRQGCTGIPVIDQAVEELYRTGMLHNHARMWLASYVIHIRKVHWRVGADWLYSHLLDGDLASNHLSWQWVAGTASHKPYLFNAENVERYAPTAWHSPASVIDTSYEALDQIARSGCAEPFMPATAPSCVKRVVEPKSSGTPPDWLQATAPKANDVEGRIIWLVHPWSLGKVPGDLPEGTQVVAVLLSEFHSAWPWAPQRWDFVGRRMAELTPLRWYGDAASIGEALKSTYQVITEDNPHLSLWLEQWTKCRPAPLLFPSLERRFDSFSAWWKKATAGLATAEELLSYEKPTSFKLATDKGRQ